MLDWTRSKDCGMRQSFGRSRLNLAFIAVVALCVALWEFLILYLVVPLLQR